MRTIFATLTVFLLLCGVPALGQESADEPSPVPESPPTVEPMPRDPPGGFDQPDMNRIVKEVNAGEAVITIFASRPCETLWQSPRDETVFTAGSTGSCYFYPQRPTSTSVVLCSESNMFNLRQSRPIRTEVTGLTPDTTYYYRVNDSREYVRFKTAPESGHFSPYQITVATDSQGPYDSAGRKDRHSLGEFEQANVAANYQYNITSDSMRKLVQPDFSLHCGDVIEDARYWIQWEKEMFGDLKYYLTQAPCIPAIGNHEYEDPRWWRFFDLPTPPQDENGSTGAYFAYEWGDTLIVAMDSNGNYYPRLDVDELPDEIVYEVTHDVIAKVRPYVDDWVLTRLETITGRRLARVDFIRTLHRLAIQPTESRVIRTAAAVASGEGPGANITRADPDPRFCDLDVLYHRKGLDKMYGWLRKTLAAHRDKRYIFLIQHHPLLYGGEGAKSIHPIFEKFGVTATFSGHWHGFAHSEKNGIHYFQSGAISNDVFSALGGGGPYFKHHRYGPAYLLVTVEAEQALVQGIGRDNRVFYEVTLSPRRPTQTEMVPSHEAQPAEAAMP